MPVTTESKRKVIEAAKGRCSACGEDGIFDNGLWLDLEVDHVVPLSEGGSNRRSNLRVFCWRCHDERHGKRPRQYANRLHQAYVENIPPRESTLKQPPWSWEYQLELNTLMDERDLARSVARRILRLAQEHTDQPVVEERWLDMHPWIKETDEDEEAMPPEPKKRRSDVDETMRVGNTPIKADGYTPRVVRECDDAVYAEMLVKLDKCAVCKKAMLPPKADGLGLFPGYIEEMAEAQRQRAGWRVKSRQHSTYNRPVCLTCAKAGLVTFTCALCKQERPSSQEQDSFGEPAEYLCVPCYETVSAKEWEAKAKQLRDAHRWDFE